MVPAILAAGYGTLNKSDASSSSRLAAHAAKKSPVKIGLIVTLGTPAVNETYYVAADTAAIDDLNQSGGLGGHPVKLDVCNDGGDPNKTVACANQMVSDKVIAVVGGQSANDNEIVP